MVLLHCKRQFLQRLENVFPLLDLYQTITSPTAEIVRETGMPILSWEHHPLSSPQNISTKTMLPHHQPRSGTPHHSSRPPPTLDVLCMSPRVWVTMISAGFPYPPTNMSVITLLKSWKRDLGKGTLWINIPRSSPVGSLSQTLS